MAIDDSLDILRLMTSGDDETSRVLPERLVLLDREGSNPLQTLWVRAFTDQAVNELRIDSSRREFLTDL